MTRVMNFESGEKENFVEMLQCRKIYLYIEKKKKTITISITLIIFERQIGNLHNIFFYFLISVIRLLIKYMLENYLSMMGEIENFFIAFFLYSFKNSPKMKNLANRGRNFKFLLFFLQIFS